ncbi:hypothetical protein NE237_018586 [Protea cynaroides]|uniref:Uncharacterized protein n=1 Tax=Protea cynaroides TaxID=273540 RepID=A0A9Q0KA67_9MAGN|nr:hypothetical protein NE237_018586 [Protea cynaroides]
MGRRKLTHQTRNPSFFKVLLSGFKKQLRIPTEFIKHVNGKLPGKFNLQSPNGTWWLVKFRVTIYDNRSACEKVIPLAKKRRNDERQEPVSEAINQFSKKVVKPREKKRKRAFKIKINGKLEAVRLLETEHPHFTQILRPNLRYQITIPRALAVESGLVGNNLEEGDACVFEFLQQATGDDPIFVHIFRAGAEILEPINSGLTANVRENRSLLE